MSDSQQFKRAYRFRFYPTPEQENLLRRTVGCCRLVYNKALHERSTAWIREQRKVSYKDTSALLTGWKKTDDLDFLNEVSGTYSGLMRTSSTRPATIRSIRGSRTGVPPNTRGARSNGTGAASHWRR